MVSIDVPVAPRSAADPRHVAAWHVAAAVVILARNSAVLFGALHLLPNDEGDFRIGRIECSALPPEPIHKLMLVGGIACEQLVFTGVLGLRPPGRAPQAFKRLWTLASDEVRLHFMEISALASQLMLQDYISPSTLRQTLGLPPAESYTG